MKIAFDIDDTILVPGVARIGFAPSGDNVPNYEVIAILKFFQAQGADIILWSGSGVDWALRWGQKFGLEPFTVRMKQKSEDIDICFDDCIVDLAKVNVRVKRLKNGVSRKEWNETIPEERLQGSVIKIHKARCAKNMACAVYHAPGTPCLRSGECTCGA